MTPYMTYILTLINLEETDMVKVALSTEHVHDWQYWNEVDVNETYFAALGDNYCPETHKIVWVEEITDFIEHR